MFVKKTKNTKTYIKNTREILLKVTIVGIIWQSKKNHLNLFIKLTQILCIILELKQGSLVYFSWWGSDEKLRGSGEDSVMVVELMVVEVIMMIIEIMVVEGSEIKTFSLL